MLHKCPCLPQKAEFTGPYRRANMSDRTCNASSPLKGALPFEPTLLRMFALLQACSWQNKQCATICPTNSGSLRDQRAADRPIASLRSKSCSTLPGSRAEQSVLMTCAQIHVQVGRSGLQGPTLKCGTGLLVTCCQLKMVPGSSVHKLSVRGASWHIFDCMAVLCLPAEYWFNLGSP